MIAMRRDRPYSHVQIERNDAMSSMFPDRLKETSSGRNIAA